MTSSTTRPGLASAAGRGALGAACWLGHAANSRSNGASFTGCLRYRGSAARQLLRSDGRMAMVAQPIGSPRALLLAVLPIATLGCARGAANAPTDGQAVADAPRSDAATNDTQPADAVT